MIHAEYIAEILGRFEGKALTKGYVPRNKAGDILGASGVTIGTGFDLGQQGEAELTGLKLPAALAAKLRPYLGLKRRRAVEKLEREPLELTREETAALDKAVHETYIMETAAMFGREAFEAAPKQAQAVAVSLHYQFGTPRRAASPALGLAWEALRAGKYQEAAEYLTAPSGWSADHRAYLPRRKQEAALLGETGGGHAK